MKVILDFYQSCYKREMFAQSLVCHDSTSEVSINGEVPNGYSFPENAGYTEKNNDKR